mmetsp:Transcript_58644/g.170168  ORF Transcript_58644/g.170168 Transcript_58644/m.170168 type:complete len:325 (+) Transcript_58644:58-1032(+)
MFSACRAMADMRKAGPAHETIPREKAGAEQDSGDETTPTTTVSDVGDLTTDDEAESAAAGLEGDETESDDPEVEHQLGPGLFPPDAETRPAPAPPLPPTTTVPKPQASPMDRGDAGAGFTSHETLLVFDWDDTILPSTWLQRQGLRLDSRSSVSVLQREHLGQVAATAAKMLRLAKQSGTVVLLTNAERGWIELSCTKFLPALLPTIENVKIVSARTTYETAYCTAPLDWKVLAFEAEIARACGPETLADPSKRKNIHSFGDSAHEREALMRATANLPNCFPKSLKFVERPDISQILKQHTLVTASMTSIVQHDGHLDLNINCP